MFKLLSVGWLALAGRLLVLSCLLAQAAAAQTAPTFDMAARVLAPGANSRPFSHDIAVDAAGNSYVSGQFSGSVRLGSTTVSSAGAGSTYIAKIDATGSYRWIVTINTNGNNGALGMGVNSVNLAVDAAGNLRVAGSFSGPTLTLGNITLTNAGGSDLFVGRLDTNGNWLSAVRAGGASNETVSRITLDGSGNAYLTGAFSDAATFGSSVLTTAGAEDLFVARLDANNIWRWAVRGGSNGYDLATDVALDAAGHAYIAGMVSGTGGQLGVFAVPRAMVVAQLDAATGAYQRVTSVLPGSATSLTSGFFIGRLAVDAAGVCYLAGRYLGSLTFGAYTVSSIGTTVSLDDVFVAKLDAAGTWQWARTAGGTYGASCAGIAVDDRDGIYISGSFRGLTQFGSITLVSQNISLLFDDIYVAKLDATGNWLWAVPAGGQQDDRETSFALGPFATPYVVGEYFSPAMNFGPLAVPGDPTLLTSTFVARMQPNRLRIAGDSVLCSGGGTLLTASTLGTGMRWRWNTGAATASITVTQPGTYTVTATFPNGYSLSETYRVRGIPPPTVAITGNAGYLCPGTPRQLTAVAAGAVAWGWSTGETTPSITITQPGTYSVTAAFSTACTATAQAVVVGNEVRISGRLQLCPGQSTTLTATATGAAVTGYRWDTGATTPTLLVRQAGTYRVTATFADGCQLTATHTVGPPVAKVASVSGDTILCRGTTLTLTALNPDALSYRWNTGATTPTVAIAQPGTYGVVLTYAGGCTSRDSLRVLPAYVIPTGLTLGADTTMCLEEPLLLRAPAVAGPGVSLSWSDGSHGPTLTVRENGVYSLRISTSCESITLRRGVSYTSCLLIPNVITPNEDQQNDRFFVRNMTGGDWDLTLYNRWGRQVYHTTAYHQEWGRDAAPGLYYYILRRPIVNVLYKGWLEVIR
ncbi:gliding motility-associated C-terminal domain-containing protein [Hymenobacter negativus]|uniref:Gliding motility-associated C-terminal domain-containing protein n=1 Tax=Hymenobacter negativus TaxID=2795026 RepID=A0ABS3QAT3_9BACT|nr:gliding motility-associated C-terminal domain-containing protein [Hymenobacter negativus]MBO2008369.1 gliding motility-associated C-terminal domain-containing protein [Hymenobacter negativus]